MKKLNVSIAGFGFMGGCRSVVYEAVTRYFPSCPVKPVLHQAFTLPHEAEKATASGWQAVTNLDAVITDSEAEYIDVCLPNEMHFDAVMKALEAGKHVFCEKPLAVSVEEARQMTATAEAHPQLLNSVNFIYRRCPANVYARRLIKENTFGKLLEARSYYNQGWGVDPEIPHTWRFGKNGGTLADLGSHAFDMLYYTTGMRPIELVAFQTTHIKRRKEYDKTFAHYGNQPDECSFVWRDVETDDATRVMYTLPGGAIGSLECTRNAHGTENTHGYELYFENGAISWSYDDVNYLKIYDATKPERGWNRVLTNRSGFAYHSFADGHMEGYRDFSVSAVYENLLKIASEPEIAPIATFRDAYDVERTIQAVRTSWENRAWVKLEDFK